MPISRLQYAQALCEILHKEQPAQGLQPLTDSDVSKAVLSTVYNLIADNKTTEKQKEIELEIVPARKSGYKSLNDLENSYKKKDDRPNTLITFLGETHRTPNYMNRAQEYLNNKPIDLSCIFLERGMNYQIPAAADANALDPDRIREEDLSTSNNGLHGHGPHWGMSLSLRKGRNLVAAGYLAIWLADNIGRQPHHIAMLYGSEHADIVNDLSYVIKNSAPILYNHKIQFIISNEVPEL